ncbi:hypothetical protein ACIPIN_23545 [Pseudomonas sp. NPDC087697]|uniref:hypothetical protein n=1 Tax=Pseudomonas sp. NPDC087697 TaxID=3364447 RepID=UPI00380F80C6
MQSHDFRFPVNRGSPPKGGHPAHPTECNCTINTSGGNDMEPRVVELETHLKYIRRDMEEVRNDVKSIKHRIAYSAGAAAVIIGLLGWIANSRFDQLVMLLNS